ncbi:CpsD/CapB family tyrosine-protein kinase [Cognatishimia activa]|uniref:CpsD/CapB family tyrosine-protein kinase n=1 Tax=Cognatishimia activa TaxID=1715691 RepID=UPI002231D516|nr:CpsD/CapB family tyrosine-protein kinase [Cognatishimia activa]UZD92472.1 CpsD/CapB family tyrosine-protein kinase [Cognatishimia activa]
MLVKSELEENPDLETVQDTSETVGFDVVYRRILDAKLPLLIICSLTFATIIFSLSLFNKRVLVFSSEYRVVSVLDKEVQSVVDQFWEGDEDSYKEDLFSEFVSTFNQELEPSFVCSVLSEKNSKFLRPIDKADGPSYLLRNSRFLKTRALSDETGLCEGRFEKGLVATRLRSSSHGFEIEISCAETLKCAVEIEEALIKAITVTIENSRSEISRQILTEISDLRTNSIDNCSRSSCDPNSMKTTSFDLENAAAVLESIQNHTKVFFVKINEKSHSKRRYFDFSLTNILAIAFGCCLFVVWLMTRLDAVRGAASRFVSEDQFEGKFSAPLIGSIPVLPVKSRQDVLRYFEEKPTSSAVEAVRNIRTSILLSSIDQPPKVILSTSSIPGEGKTTLSVCLSHNLAQLGKKVLLIEGDIRRLTLDEYFNDIREDKGIISVLSGDLSLDEAVVQSELLNADVLLGQRSAVNPADVFSSERFKELIRESRQKYDFIVIDAPPVLVVPDARTIGQHCDAIVCSVKWDQTLQSQVSKLSAELRAVNLKISGFVLNQVDPRGMQRYGYGHHVVQEGPYYE